MTFMQIIESVGHSLIAQYGIAPMLLAGIGLLAYGIGTKSRSRRDDERMGTAILFRALAVLFAVVSAISQLLAFLRSIPSNGGDITKGLCPAVEGMV